MGMTWRKLKTLIDELEDDSLDFDVTVLIKDQEEVFPIEDFVIITEENEEYNQYSDIVDSGTPTIVV